MLATHPDLDQPIDHARCYGLDLAVCANNVPSIGFRLKQAWKDLNVPYRHRTRFILEPDELLIVGRQAVAIVLPPPLLGGIRGKREQEVAAGPGDLVIVEQALHLARR